MTLITGTRLGPYEITAVLGAGGMGEVYRATDTRLDRTVAIKVLPEHVAADSELRQRFEREAKTLAALSHPHICPVFDVGSQDGIHFLVMEHLEGETLAQRLTKGALPLDQALGIAIQIADALDKTHRRGIVHRDLKPGNIMLTKSGAKLLDFGLAKLRPANVVGGVALSEAPTVSRPFGVAQGEPLTGAGSILGTFQYMAPEQLEGQEADPRTDIFAFGAVLYEMVTGQKAFEGRSQASLIAAILERDPAPMSSLQPVAPAALDRVVKKCLAKEPGERWQTTKDLYDELQWIADAGTQARAIPELPAAARPVVRSRIGLALLGMLCTGLGVAGGAAWFTRRAAPSAVVRMEVTTPSGAALTVNPAQRSIAVTPDGSRIIYVGRDGADRAALFVRALGELAPRTILTSMDETVGSPFMSPDGGWVGFFTAGRLWKVAITGGPAVSVIGLDSALSRGATWGEDGTIIYATGNTQTGLQRVSADGGMAEVLTTPNPTQGEADHFWPELLPGGQAVLFTIWPPSGGIDNAQIAVLDLRSGAQRVLVRGGSDARYVSSGHVLFTAGGGLRSVSFDLRNLVVTGTPGPVIDGVSTSTNGSAESATAANGTLVYVARGPQSGRELVWVDRQGKEEPLGAPLREYRQAKISPDGTRVAVFSGDQAEDIWVWDFETRVLSRLTFDPGTDQTAVWTPDSRRLIFSSEADTAAAANSLYDIPADGSGAARRLTMPGELNQFALSVTRDGSRVIYQVDTPTSGIDIMQVPLVPPVGDAPSSSPVTPTVLLKTEFNESGARLSPTDQWMAYQSDESGRYEVYVRPYPNVQAERFQVSTEGGGTPRWSRDGRELFYLSSDDVLMAVRVEPGSAWRTSAPMRLISRGSQYLALDVSTDGQRFLTIKEAAGGASTMRNLVVVQHFDEELKRLLPTN